MFGNRPTLDPAGSIRTHAGGTPDLGEMNFTEGVPRNLPGVTNTPNFSAGGVPQLQSFGAVPNVNLSAPNYQTSLGPQGPIQRGVTPNAREGSGALSSNANINGTGVDLTTTSAFKSSHDQLFDAIMQRQTPWLEREQRALDTKLANQGITQGGEAFQEAQEIQGMRMNDMRLAAEMKGFEQKIGEQMANLAARKQGSDEQFAQSYLQNMAEGQRFNQSLMGNQTDFGQRLAAGQFGNAAQQQGFNQSLAAGQFGNQARGQQFQDQLAGAGLNTNINMANIANILAGNNQALAANQQGFNQAIGAAGFNRDSALSQFNQGLALNSQQLAQQQQAYQQMLGQAGFNNQTALQQFGMNLQGAQFQNQAQNQGFNQGLASTQFLEDQRARAIQEAQFMQMQPLNVLNALRTGNQTQMPQFGNWSGGASIAPPPIYNAAQDQFAAEMARYNAQMQSAGGFMGGLASLGGAAMMSPWIGGK